MLNFKHLQYFNAVYQYKNFTQAGDSLFVSQPTISAAINTLESELGVKLIERSPKNVIFTYEGEQFILWVRKILSLCQEAETAMHDLSDSAEQHLRLGMSYAFMDSAAPPVFSDFLDEHPNAQIDLDEGSMQKLLRMVHEEQLDLAYNAIPDAVDCTGLEVIPISKAEIRVVLHPDHPLAKLERIPLSLLSQEKLVMMDTQSKVNQIMCDAFERQHLPMNVVLNYTQILCMTSLVRFCNYAGFLCEAAGCSTLGHEGLVIRSLEDPIFMDLGFFFRKGRYLPKLGWELIRFLQAKEQPRLAVWEAQHAQFLTKQPKASKTK